MTLGWSQHTIYEVSLDSTLGLSWSSVQPERRARCLHRAFAYTMSSAWRPCCRSTPTWLFADPQILASTSSFQEVFTDLFLAETHLLFSHDFMALITVYDYKFIWLYAFCLPRLLGFPFYLEGEKIEQTYCMVPVQSETMNK